MNSRQNAQLWATLLVPPLVWGLHLQISYSLHPSACASNSRWMLIGVSIVLIVPVLLMGWMALALLRSMPEPHATGHAGAAEEIEPRPRGRARFMASSGLMGACLFALLILGQTVPMVMLRPCD
ncbi:MAG: hypothetical protein ACTHQM_12405 [Thermoanaerobaculia bacterium]